MLRICPFSRTIEFSNMILEGKDEIIVCKPKHYRSEGGSPSCTVDDSPIGGHVELCNRENRSICFKTEAG